MATDDGDDDDDDADDDDGDDDVDDVDDDDDHHHHADLPLSNGGNWLALAAQRVSLCREGGSPPHGGTAATLEQVLGRNDHATAAAVALVVRRFRLAM